MPTDDFRRPVRKREQVVDGQSTMEPNLIHRSLEFDWAEPLSLINEQKIRRSKRIALNRKYKRKRRRSDDGRS